MTATRLIAVVMMMDLHKEEEHSSQAEAATEEEGDKLPSFPGNQEHKLLLQSQLLHKPLTKLKLRLGHGSPLPGTKTKPKLQGYVSALKGTIDSILKTSKMAGTFSI